MPGQFGFGPDPVDSIAAARLGALLLRQFASLIPAEHRVGRDPVNRPAASESGHGMHIFKPDVIPTKIRIHCAQRLLSVASGAVTLVVEPLPGQEPDRPFLIMFRDHSSASPGLSRPEAGLKQLAEQLARKVRAG